MMSSLAFALALVLAPPGDGPAASGAPAASGTRALLDEKITISLRDADLVQVLERLATLLGKTLILQPGIEGKVSLDVRETPVSEVLASLQASHGLLVRLEGDRMYVKKPADKPRAGTERPDDEALDRELLSDASLLRRPAADKPKRFDGAFEFRAGGAASAWQIGGSLGTVTLPGCAAPVRVVLFPGDVFDGVPRVAFAPVRAGDTLARIVAPGGTVRLPDCSAPLVLRALDSGEGSSRAVPVSPAGQYGLTARVLDAGADGDRALSEAHLVLAGGEAGTIKSGDRRTGASGAILNQLVLMNAGILNAGDDDAVVACSVSVTRDVEPARGEPLVTIRIARADESLRLAYGKPERITVSPTYGRGRSALVLELTLERLPEKGPAR
jgi:hypothetical protein